MTTANPLLSQARRVMADPSQFASLLTIVDKQGRHVRFRHNRIQRHFFQHYSLGTKRIDLVAKSRQGGLSTGVVGEITRLEWTRLTRALTLINTDKNTAKIRRIARRMYDYFPAVIDCGGVPVRKPRRREDNDTTTTYDNESEWTIGTAGSPDSARAGTSDVLHGSETAFWKDADLVIAAAHQAAEAAFWKVHESTGNGEQGWFFESCMKAADGDTDFKLHFYPWWWTDEYADPLEDGETLRFEPDEAELIQLHGLTPEQIKFRRRKQRELGMLFPQEYAEDLYSCFVSSGGGFFSLPPSAFSAPVPEGPSNDKPHVAGLDWGQANDYTDMSIGDPESCLQVDRLHINRMPYADMRARVVAKCIAWNITELVAETNSMGGTNIEELRRELRDAGLQTRIVPFTTTAKDKRNGLISINNALATGELRLLPDPVQRAEFRAFAAVQLPSGEWQYKAPSGQHDDTVMSAMMMWHAIAKPQRKLQWAGAS
jgi:hypothetical protein